MIMTWIGRGLSILVSLVFIMSGVMKLKGGDDLAKGLEHLGLPISMVVPLAILELACVAVYLVPRTAVIGAILLTGYMGGAILTHWRVGDPFVVQVLLGVCVWLGVWLREKRLRALIPLRSTNTSA
jgi:uncharacterized membrane protein YphA (DoxX/SURF4 family)